MTDQTRKSLIRSSIGLGFALLVFLVFILPGLRDRTSGTSRPDEGSLASTAREVKEKKRLAGELRNLTEELSVTIPEADPTAQVQLFVETLQKVSSQSGVGFSRFEQKTVSPSRVSKERRPGGEVGFNLGFESTHDNLVKFLLALHEAGPPARVESFSVESKGQPDKLDVKMEVFFIILEPMQGTQPKRKEGDDAEKA